MIFRVACRHYKETFTTRLWCRENAMVNNTDKTKVLLITSRQKSYNLQNDNVLLNSNDLKLSSNEKILGVQIEDNLIWNGHF